MSRSYCAFRSNERILNTRSRPTVILGRRRGREVVHYLFCVGGDPAVDSVGTTCQRGIDANGFDPLHLSLPRFGRPLNVAGNMQRASAPSNTSEGATLKLFRGQRALLTCLAFSGCVLRGPELEVKSPVEIKAERNGQFCPPGQAKKATAS